MCFWEWLKRFHTVVLVKTHIPVHFQVYRQDCETFGMVVKMLIAKDPNLEKQLQVPLRENLGEIRERCLEDLKHFINELDEVVRQPEPSVCDSTTPSTSLASQKLSKTGVNHSSSYWRAVLVCTINVRSSIIGLSSVLDGYPGHMDYWTEAFLQHSNLKDSSAWREAAGVHCMWGWTVLVLNLKFTLLKTVYKIFLKVLFCQM